MGGCSLVRDVYKDCMFYFLLCVRYGGCVMTHTPGVGTGSDNEDGNRRALL